MEAQDEVERGGVVEHPAVGVLGVARGPGEAAVMVGHVVGQEGVGLVDGVYAAKAQLLDQAVLEGLVGPFHPALGWGVLAWMGWMSRVLSARVN